MIVDCEWIERNLESLFCDTLNSEQSQLAREHIETCESCRREVVSLKAIDGLVKQNFRRELATARRPRAVNKARVFGVSGAALAMVAVLLFVALRLPQTNPVAPALQPPPPVPTVVVEPAPIKEEPGPLPKLAKPTPEPDRQLPRNSGVVVPVTPDSPEFLVTDPAGYSHTVDEYRGHVVVLGVWNRSQLEPTSNFERLYKTFGANPKLRFLGVANERLTKPAGLTFPVLYNQGSKLFGAKPGEFVLLDPMGSVKLRGSLVGDFESLRRALEKM